VFTNIITGIIGEAIRQITTLTDFTVRHVHFKTGLVLHEGQDTEIKYYKKGFIKPFEPCKDFSVTHIAEALRYMQKGQRMGKIVVTMPESLDVLPVSPPQSKFIFGPIELTSS
jgi:hypothetical protein